MSATSSSSKKDEVREAAEASLWVFANLVGPTRMYGAIHEEAMNWLQRGGDSNDLILLPRDHLKSHMIAVWCAWTLTRAPWETILYVSATDDLATNQISAIKDILTSDIYRRYWPDMVNDKEALREQWAQTDIKLDHPDRKRLAVRDASVAARSIKANTTGLHCTKLVLDDIVAPVNAYTAGGRDDVARGYSQLASVLSAGGCTKAVGTLYHPQDIYNTMRESKLTEYDVDGRAMREVPQYRIFERVVEEAGVFLWPRTQHPKTRMWFGYNQMALEQKKATYFAANQMAQFYAQYYNDPNRSVISADTTFIINYYNPQFLKYDNEQWWFKDRLLRLYAGGDIAYTVNKKSDYTAFAVIGIDFENNVYILDLHQLRTDEYEEYYKAIEQMYDKWHFRNLRIETNAGANVIAKYIKTTFASNGKSLIINPQLARGDKIERSAAALVPRYNNGMMWHFRGGFMNVYEEQVKLARPSHDDLRDAVCIALEDAKAPGRPSSVRVKPSTYVSSSRFGGLRRA